MKQMKGLLVAVAVIAVTMIMVAQKAPSQNEKLQIAEYAISEYYVDTVNESKIVEDAIVGMLDKLDPHSSYSNAEETKELNEPLEGNFSGIGIQFNMKQDTLYVIQTIVGGPSEKLGIIAGDRIIAVNDTSIAGVKMKTSAIMKRLRGVKGTKVNVLVKRKGVVEPILFRITRDAIPLYSIDASYMLDNKTGYVRISRFAAETHKEFLSALKKLKKAGMTQLVLDLSDNGGGYLQAAVEMANEFLEKGQSIVYTEGRKSPRYDAKAIGTGGFKTQKVVVIVNQYSASASEILAGALQDWDRAIIVGRRSFGKGLVQRPFPFRDGSMIRLTVARYFTPSGRCIQKHYEGGDKESYEKDIYNRLNSGELASADSIHFADSLKYTTLKNKRVIYGGGGIMPDVFVPLDTTAFTKYYRNIVAKGILNQYCIDYIDKNRNMLKANYSTIQDYEAKFVVSEDMIKDLQMQATKDSVKFDAQEYKRSEVMIKDVVKALVARDLFDMESYFRIMNHSNELVKSALGIINDDKEYNKYLLRDK
ncbi:MAG: S41 family peptidase [Muribaculaceae bacterium]